MVHRGVSVEDLSCTWCDEIIIALWELRDPLIDDDSYLPSGLEAYCAWHDALDLELTLDALRSLDEVALEKIRDEFRDLWETTRIETAHIKTAVEGTIWHYAEE
jgi:hypothetical protein